jgi:hypothetical protein
LNEPASDEQWGLNLMDKEWNLHVVNLLFY